MTVSVIIISLNICPPGLHSEHRLLTEKTEGNDANDATTQRSVQRTLPAQQVYLTAPLSTEKNTAEESPFQQTTGVQLHLKMTLKKRF